MREVVFELLLSQGKDSSAIVVKIGGGPQIT